MFSGDLEKYGGETRSVRMGDELCRLHPQEKIRDRGELDTVDIFCQGRGLVHAAAVQEQDPGAVKRAVFQDSVSFSGKVREDAHGDGGLQVRVGRESAGKVYMGQLRGVHPCVAQKAVDHGVGGCFGVQILADICLGEVQGLSGGAYTIFNQINQAFVRKITYFFPIVIEIDC